MRMECEKNGKSNVQIKEREKMRENGNIGQKWVCNSSKTKDNAKMKQVR